MRPFSYGLRLRRKSMKLISRGSLVNSFDAKAFIFDVRWKPKSRRRQKLGQRPKRCDDVDVEVLPLEQTTLSSSVSPRDSVLPSVSRQPSVKLLWTHNSSDVSNFTCCSLYMTLHLTRRHFKLLRPPTFPQDVSHHGFTH